MPQNKSTKSVSETLTLLVLGPVYNIDYIMLKLDAKQQTHRPWPTREGHQVDAPAYGPEQFDKVLTLVLGPVYNIDYIVLKLDAKQQTHRPWPTREGHQVDAPAYGPEQFDKVLTLVLGPVTLVLGPVYNIDYIVLKLDAKQQTQRPWPTREGDEVDAPAYGPEPAHQHEGDGEELGQAHHAVRAQDVQGLVALAGLPGLAAAQQGNPAEDRAWCGQREQVTETMKEEDAYLLFNIPENNK
ncbi:hypothetical protein EGW08_005683 [Elysia chlorotica]|uniref:Uncharacterized protein n=1 Tax=Elysia chlorotica TaxID=188477 RepID=A0A433TY70_ELYCH|nr:hypothetical protein EGW08_005683 [Elysia chlorotica]